MRHESKAYTYIKHACEDVGAFYYKIPDTLGQRFTPPKPFDLLVTFRGVSIYMEVKYYKDLAAFSTKNLSDNQNESLSLILDNRDHDKVYIRPMACLFVYRPREIKRLYFFCYGWLKKNPQKKTDMKLITKYVDVEKDTFNLHDMFANMIGF